MVVSESNGVMQSGDLPGSLRIGVGYPNKLSFRQLGIDTGVMLPHRTHADYGCSERHIITRTIR
jgi:hypothetical protein